MSQAIRLDSGWKLGRTAFWGEYSPPPKDAARVCTLDADVPGDAHLDLMRAGMLPELYEGMNTDHALWMEHKDWWYRREFPTPPDIEGKTVLLVFHGLDTFASVWVNQQPVGQAANMFIRHEFDVTPWLSSTGINELVVRLAAPAFSIPFDSRHRPLGGGERLFCRKAQMSFGWDIAPRLLTVGIWRPVELVVIDTARITGVMVTPIEFHGEDARVSVEASVLWTGVGSGEATVCGRIHDVTWRVTAPMTPGRNTVQAEILLKRPPLWWPIGYGQPSSIETHTIVEVEGRQVDSFATRAGLRRIELVREPQPSGAESFRFRCNGVDMLVTGLNWTPLDAIFARVTPERITRTLERLAGIGCNMLRVWGGGIYEPAHFYAECSRLGIMVWQDFMMACGWYPQTDTFAAALALEAEQVVRDLRGFPCMAIWAGDNEVDGCHKTLAAGNRLTRQVLAEICRRLDPQTPYVPSSPWRPSGALTAWVNETEGDTHHYAFDKDYRAPESWDIHPRFISEFGVLSLPSLDAIRKYFAPEEQWPLIQPAWKFHGADTMRVGTFQGGPASLLRGLAANGKPEPQTLEEAVGISQELQSEAICAWIERYCEDPEFGGFLLWNVTDCWPQISSSVIDCMDNEKIVFARLGPLFERVRARRKVR